jgi:hypothetical protein
MSDIVCQGSILLGSGCRRCSRCRDVVEALVRSGTVEDIETLVASCHVRLLHVEGDEIRRLYVDTVDAEAVNYLFPIQLIQMEISGLVQCEELELDDGWVGIYSL